MKTWSLFSFLGAVAISTVALASPIVKPNITSPFGSEDFTVSYLQSPHPDPSFAPPWSPIVSCGQVSPAPKLIYADDPEQWTYVPIDDYPSTWTYTNPGGTQMTVNNLELVSGDLPANESGLIYWYFENELGVTARLYIGAISTGGSTATFSYIARQNTNGAAGALTNGAVETSNFLRDYVTSTNYENGEVNSGPTPTPIKTYTLPNGKLSQGEIFVTDQSGPTTFYLYADDCTGTPCPSIANQNLKGDGHFRRGDFKNAAFLLVHNYNPALETGSGGFSWYDLVSDTSCVDLIPGTDPFNYYTPRNSGDYGVPITVSGAPDDSGGGTEYEQYWFMTGSPAGLVSPTPDTFAVYVQGMVDDSTGVNVTGNWAVPFPATDPPTPSPQPSPLAMPCCMESANLGLDTMGSTRTIIWIPSGDDSLPARFWYNIPVPGDHVEVKGTPRY